MKKVLITTLLASGALITAMPAQAQEPSPFTGFRIEALGGYDTLRNGSDVDIDEDSDEDIDQSIDGFVYGVGAGFDFDLGGFVAGVEGEFTDSTGKQDADEVINAPFAFRASIGRDLYVGARVGMRVMPSTLVYVKGGYTSTKVNAAIDDLDADDDVDFTTDADQTVDGYRIGAGIEHLLGDSLGVGSSAYVKLEYRYSKYDDLSFDDDFFTDENSVDIDLDRHQVVAGLGIRF
ncbi:outer membrane protein [Rhizorhapis suberifaciens]|uniref:Outer membrane immunogenic protein n=1 Tax=Rhizorhapis suberifaciens TaxID=13656 RepID=A0A840HWI5_9SPHN|nr:outer membrane beta-barrel protein [Rhizorhapis suberifaciens]MBB4641940.1 outer membrane immunogenic protein [Rhizorhapis suberifaciens]